MSHRPQVRRDEREPPPVELRPLPHHARAVGVFTLRAFPAGALVLPFRGEVVPEPDRWTIQIGRDLHLMGNGGPEVELRHACEPTARIVTDGTPPAGVVALRDLEPGDEVTLDYCATEASMAEPFDCACGADACYGRVGGWERLPTAVQDRMRWRVAPWLVEPANRPDGKGEARP